MNIKSMVVGAVRILTSGQLIQQPAHRVTQQKLPLATHYVASKSPTALQDVPDSGWPCKHRFKQQLRSFENSGRDPVPQPEIHLSDALRIKSAEFWLKLGETEQALLEIRSLPEHLQNHPWVLRTRLALVRANPKSAG